MDNVNDIYAFLYNRQNHTYLSVILYTLVVANTINYGLLGLFAPSTFRGALRRIKFAAYLVLSLWFTYRIFNTRSFDLPLTEAAFLGWVGVSFTDGLYGISSQFKRKAHNAD